ncbi:MAG: malonate decarboxylase subunit alpha [Mycobacterium leprae]
MKSSFLDAILGERSGAGSGPASFGQGPEAWPERVERLQGAGAYRGDGKVVAPEQARLLLEALLRPGDTVALEGSPDKQARFLAATLAEIGRGSVRDLHLVVPVIALSEQIHLLKGGAVSRLSYASAGGLSAQVNEACQAGNVQVATPLSTPQLLAHQLLDRPIQVALVAADEADERGNLCTGGTPGDTRSIARNVHLHGGLVVAQVNRVVGRVSRVEVPGEWVDFVIPVPAAQPHGPVATLDPVQITPAQVLLALLLLRGVYAEYRVATICHDNSLVAAAVELMLPTVGRDLGLRGQVCSHWVGVPRPSLIPAVESGFVARVLPLSTEPGMERYMAARRRVFPVGPHGQPAFDCWEAATLGVQATDLFLRTPMVVDVLGNYTLNRSDIIRGESRVGALVVLVCETFRTARNATFVESFTAGDALPGERVTHIVTEVGVSDLRRCETAAERQMAIRTVAGYTDPGLRTDPDAVIRLQRRGVVRKADDLGINRLDATLDLLAARQLRDLAEWSGGLYDPPGRMRNW